MTKKSKTPLPSVIQNEHAVEPVKTSTQNSAPEQIIATPNVLEGLKISAGTKSDELTVHLLNQLAGILPPGLAESGIKPFALLTALQHAIQPKDELEALLASQMVASHSLAMKFLSQANRDDLNNEQTSINVERANKLMRTFAAQVEALNKYRSKGQQKVVVEHIHVNDGGNAIIGTIGGRPGGI